jgi:hypothetical protein
MRQAFAWLTVALSLAGAASASAQMIYAPQSIERYFRVEWQVTHDRKGPAVEEYVYNTAYQTAPGDLSMNDRAYFNASVPEAASYRVQVLSFDWACQGGGGGM